MSKPDLLDRETGSEKRPKRTPNLLRGSYRWAGAIFAGLTALACAQTFEAPIIPVQPDLLVAFKDGTYKNIPNRMPAGDELELQTTCPTGTTFFWASEISRYYQKLPNNVEPRGAYLASGVYNNDGSLKWFHLSYHPTTPSTFEGNIVLDCKDDFGLIVTRMGRYSVNSK